MHLMFIRTRTKVHCACFPHVSQKSHVHVSPPGEPEQNSLDLNAHKILETFTCSGPALSPPNSSHCQPEFDEEGPANVSHTNIVFRDVDEESSDFSELMTSR